MVYPRKLYVNLKNMKILQIQTKKKEKAAKKKPSILQKLKKFKEKVAAMPRKDKEKRKEQER